MTLFYKMRRNNDATKPRACNKWYARAYHTETVDLQRLCESMQRNSTVKQSDILAVLVELSHAMRHQLQAGKRVHIDGLGTFMIGLSSDGVVDPSTYHPDSDLRRLHIVFQAERVRGCDGHLHDVMVMGTRVRRLPSDDLPNARRNGTLRRTVGPPHSDDDEAETVK